MPAQQIPPAPVVVGGVVSRRHAKLLHHLFEGNNGGASANAPVKDLRIRRVVPPASAPPPYASPDPPAAVAAKPGPTVQIQVQSTPPEPSAAAAAEDRERKPILPRSKLVRDPASFGYRRLLPFLNQMGAKNGSDISGGKDAPSEPKVSLSNKVVGRSDSGLVDESVDGSQGVAAPVDSVEPLAPVVAAPVDSVDPAAVMAVGDREMKDCCDTAREEHNVVPADPAGSKPCVTRCARSKFVHQPSSFSYKRMLPFLTENEVSSEDLNRAKIRRVSEEEHITSECSPEELDGVVEEVASISDGECVGQIQSAVVEASLDGGNTAEVQRVTQEKVPVSAGDPVSSEMGESTSDMSAVPVGLCQPAVSEDSPRQKDVAGAEATVEEKASQSDEKSALTDSVEPLVAKAGGDQEMKDPCDSVKEQTRIVPGDVASSKPCPTRCTRSRLVHQRNSFSYKRMLPFIMENDISSLDGDKAKFQRVPEEKQLASSESDVIASGHDGQLQSGVAEVSPGSSGTSEVEKVAAEVVLSSDKDGVLAGGQCQLAVSEDSPKENNVAEAERVVEEEATKSDENSILDGRDLQSAVSEVSLQKGDTEKEVIQKTVFSSDGDGANELGADKGESLLKDQPQLCDPKKLQANAELSEVQQCQNSECPDVAVASPTNTVVVDKRQDSVATADSLLLDAGVISKPSEPCASDASLSAEEISDCLTQAESGLRKVPMLRPCGSPSLEKQCLSPKKLSPVTGAFSGISFLKKRVLSPKKLSPKKGILKRHTMGCKGICMCLDCSVFRLRADRAFEFSRKQMHEADDIIGNLLEEVASLRSLAEKPSGQQEQVEEACQRSSRVEEVARERWRQMQAELNAHCKIPGPRVKFAQYVDEKMASSPSCSTNSSSRRQHPL
uniref:Uncharacterized protein n=1 Tax=Avena sativa TaxID=4498 RepID=A0ACD5V9J8_AVESA